MNKYLPLYQYLSKLETNHVKLSFNDIEEIISDELPMSAKKYRAWWSNGGHIQADSWLEAGWIVTSIQLNDSIEMKRKK